jgi:hypothetical protein
MYRAQISRYLIKPVRRHIDFLRHSSAKALMRRTLAGQWRPEGTPRVLVVGVYVSSVANLASDLAKEFASAKFCIVEQRWASLGDKSSEPRLAELTAMVQKEKMGKFELLNRLVSGVDRDKYDYIVCADDDVSVNPGFLDQYIAIQQKLNFAICQPARSWTSHLDHEFVRRNPKLIARQTWFVEIGPIFSFSRVMAKRLIPFDLETPMGWGYDFVWPRVVRDEGEVMGVIDHTPVDHTLRRRGAIYSSSTAADQGRAYRKKHNGLQDHEAFVTVKAYGKGEAI